MALLLSIDTAMENAGLCISDDEQVLVIKTNTRQADHASWLHLAIEEALREAGKQADALDAVAVTSGPGSYTGLRVGMAAAKGLCYVLNIPLITESTLHLTAFGVKKTIGGDAWICPMIDARRMEVFTTLYDEALREQAEPAAMILDPASFGEVLDRHQVVFCGNGSPKWQPVCTHPHALFSPYSYSMNELAAVSLEKFRAAAFTDLAWSEPAYLKNVYMGGGIK